jgi:hypothetical protein
MCVIPALNQLDHASFEIESNKARFLKLEQVMFYDLGLSVNP